MARDICILFGRRVRQLRKANNWRQIDLAEQAGINENYVSDLELGHKEICLRTIKNLATAFDISIAELFKDL